MIELEQDGEVFVLTMAAGENRWNTTFVREFDAALDQVAASSGPAALLTRSADAKSSSPTGWTSPGPATANSRLATARYSVASSWPSPAASSRWKYPRCAP